MKKQMDYSLHSMHAICNASFTSAVKSLLWKPGKASLLKKRSVLTNCNKTDGSRRSLMLSVGVSVLVPVVRTSKVTAEEVARSLDKSSKVVEEWKTLSSPAGFEFMYPGSWIVAFNRLEASKENVNVFVGNFLTVDTFSVQKTATNPTNGALVDLKSLSNAYMLPLRQSDMNVAFEVCSEGSRVLDRRPTEMYVVEYEAEICRGQISEGLGGKRLCKGSDDADVPTVKRRHYLGVTKTSDTIFYLNASSLSSRWDTVKDDLLKTLTSFVVKT